MRPLIATPLAVVLAMGCLATPVLASVTPPPPASDGTLDDDGGLTGNTGSVTPIGGGTGSPGTSHPGSTIIRPTPPCRYVFWLSGPGMATFIGPLYQRPSQAAILAHATDTGGSWYHGECVFSSGDGSPLALERRATAFYDSHPPVWATSNPPVPPIPVSYLIDAVKDSAQIPDPAISLNPVAETTVGLRTWVWPTGGAPAPVTARAESGPNWAQVTATPGRLTLSAPDAEVGSCATAPAYTAGAPESATQCFVTFRRSSARTGTSTISARLTWRVVLTTSDGRNQVLSAAFPSSTDVPIAVAQVQSIGR